VATCCGGGEEGGRYVMELTEMKFSVPLDTEQIIPETLFPASHTL